MDALRCQSCVCLLNRNLVPDLSFRPGLWSGDSLVVNSSAPFSVLVSFVERRLDFAVGLLLIRHVVVRPRLVSKALRLWVDGVKLSPCFPPVRASLP